jgi:hypothetical protein
MGWWCMLSTTTLSMIITRAHILCPLEFFGGKQRKLVSQQKQKRNPLEKLFRDCQIMHKGQKPKQGLMGMSRDHCLQTIALPMIQSASEKVWLAELRKWVSQFSSLWQNTWDKQLKWRRICFGSQFEFSSMADWLHCYEIVVRQTIMAERIQ